MVRKYGSLKFNARQLPTPAVCWSFHSPRNSSVVQKVAKITHVHIRQLACSTRVLSLALMLGTQAWFRRGCGPWRVSNNFIPLALEHVPQGEANCIPITLHWSTIFENISSMLFSEIQVECLEVGPLLAVLVVHWHPIKPMALKWLTKFRRLSIVRERVDSVHVSVLQQDSEIILSVVRTVATFMAAIFLAMLKLGNWSARSPLNEMQSDSKSASSKLPASFAVARSCSIQSLRTSGNPMLHAV